jgi:hypothetical protein
MLDKNTFGDTPASLYLVEVLNERNNSKLVRKVSSKIHGVRTLIGQLETSNAAGFLSAHHIGEIIHLMRNSDQLTIAVDEKDTIVKELTTNICVGELKSLQRRVTKARHLEHRQAILVGQCRDGKPIYEKTGGDTLGYLVGVMETSMFVPYPIKVAHISEDITSETLKARSRRKLLRQGKKNTLYPQ